MYPDHLIIFPLHFPDGKMVTSKNKTAGSDYANRPCGHALEQVTGIEPAHSAWEADVLPLYDTCN